jgi:hypothetical protein
MTPVTVQQAGRAYSRMVPAVAFALILCVGRWFDAYPPVLNELAWCACGVTIYQAVKNGVIVARWHLERKANR